LFPRLADHVEPRTAEQAGQALTQHDVVVGEHDPGFAPAQRRDEGCSGR